MNDLPKDENDHLIEENQKTTKRKDKFLKNKRLRAENETGKESHENLYLKENVRKIKKEKSNKLFYNKKSYKNETTKRLNFEDLDDLSNQNDLKNKRSQREKTKERLNHKPSIKENSTIKRSQNKRNRDSNSKNEERKTSEIYSPYKEDKFKTYNSKVNNVSNNITPVKISKATYNSNSKIGSADKLSNSPINKKVERNIRKKNSFDSIQDSIRLKKSRSMSSSSGSRSSTKNSLESEEEVFPKTRHSPRLQKKSLKLRKINDESKSIYKNKKKKILLKSKRKPLSTVNRELKSLDKVDISSNTPRDRTPEKFKSPLKNTVLTGKNLTLFDLFILNIF